MRLYGIGFNEFGHLVTNSANVKERQIASCNPTDHLNINSGSGNQNHIHSTPIEIIRLCLGDPGENHCDQLSSVAVAWHAIAYHFVDNHLTFSPDVDTDLTQVQSVALSWDSIFAVTLDGKCLCQAYDGTSKYNVITSDKEKNVHFQKVACGNMHAVAISDSAVPWLIEQAQTKQKSVECVSPDAGCPCDGDIVERDSQSSSHIGVSSAAIDGRVDDHLVLYSRPLGDHLKVKAVTCGNEHVLLLSKIGVVFSLGIGSRGQLGHGDTENHSEPRLIEAIEAVSMVMIASGGWHSVALSDIGDVYVWGWNASGQLGLPCQTISGVRKQDAMEVATATTDTNFIQQTYVNLQTVPALLEMPGGENITAICCGSRHSAAVTENGRMLSWGWNDYGQLGHSDTRSRDRPEYVQFFNNTHVHDVFAGYWNTFVRTT